MKILAKFATALAFVAASAQSHAVIQIANAATVMENAQLTWVGGGISIDSPDRGSSHIRFGEQHWVETELVSVSGTFAGAFAAGTLGASSFSGEVGDDFVTATAQASALSHYERAGITGGASTGSNFLGNGGLNLTILPYTTAVLSFGVRTSTSISVPDSYGFAFAGLRANFGENNIYVLSCTGSLFGTVCVDTYPGYPSEAHVFWTISTGEAAYSSILYFEAVATAYGLAPVPEPASFWLLALGIIAIHLRFKGKSSTS